MNYKAYNAALDECAEELEALGGEIQKLKSEILASLSAGSYWSNLWPQRKTLRDLQARQQAAFSRAESLVTRPN